MCGSFEDQIMTRGGSGGERSQTVLLLDPFMPHDENGQLLDFSDVPEGFGVLMPSRQSLNEAGAVSQIFANRPQEIHAVLIEIDFSSIFGAEKDRFGMELLRVVHQIFQGPIVVWSRVSHADLLRVHQSMIRALSHGMLSKDKSLGAVIRWIFG